MLTRYMKSTLTGLIVSVCLFVFCSSYAFAGDVTAKTQSIPMADASACEVSCLTNGIVKVKDLDDRLITIYIKSPSDLECSDYCAGGDDGIGEAIPDPEYQEDADNMGCTEACMNACEPINPGEEFGDDDIDDDAYCGCLDGCGCGC